MESRETTVCGFGWTRSIIANIESMSAAIALRDKKGAGDAGGGGGGGVLMIEHAASDATTATPTRSVAPLRCRSPDDRATEERVSSLA
jgi:hypothetical protein